jgi:cytidyltransferase-like protein
VPLGWRHEQPHRGRPGSFDPPTLGHLDVIRRAADELHVLVVHNPGKEAMLPIAQRLSLLEQSIAEEGVPATSSSPRGAWASSTMRRT